MVDETDFEKLFDEFIDGGICEEKNYRYTCAVELYYKAFIKIIDYVIYLETGGIVDNHKQRNEEIEKLNSDVKNTRDKLHIIYRQTYKTKRDKKDCKDIKDGIKQIIALKGIKRSIKKTSEKI